MQQLAEPTGIEVAVPNVSSAVHTTRIVSGHHISEEAVARAIGLSVPKYYRLCCLLTAS